MENIKKIIILISLFSIYTIFAASAAEVDKINPNEPVADLGIYNDANSSAESDAVTKANEIGRASCRERV